MNAAFKKWFGDSKVVDKHGQPLVVYHGSPDKRFIRESGIFQTMSERFGKTDLNRAFFFTSDYRVAKTYADEHRAFDYQNAEGGVISAYLSIQHPLVIDNKGERWRNTIKRIATARSKEYDGVIIFNTIDDYASDDESSTTTVYVVFDSKQIKSVENDGTWDADDPSIASNPYGRIKLNQTPDMAGNPSSVHVESISGDFVRPNTKSLIIDGELQTWPVNKQAGPEHDEVQEVAFKYNHPQARLSNLGPAMGLSFVGSVPAPEDLNSILGLFRDYEPSWPLYVSVDFTNVNDGIVWSGIVRQWKELLKRNPAPAAHDYEQGVADEEYLKDEDVWAEEIRHPKMLKTQDVIGRSFGESDPWYPEVGGGMTVYGNNPKKGSKMRPKLRNIGLTDSQFITAQFDNGSWLGIGGPTDQSDEIESFKSAEEANRWAATASSKTKKKTGKRLLWRLFGWDSKDLSKPIFQTPFVTLEEAVLWTELQMDIQPELFGFPKAPMEGPESR